jgi:hypothetical protein
MPINLSPYVAEGWQGSTKFKLHLCWIPKVS